jgi:hypothetical protein
MKRTQVQLPDWLFVAAHDLADSKEISLAELVRRGLEYMLAVTPAARKTGTEWTLPPAHDLQGKADFSAPGWREALHMEHLNVAENPAMYEPNSKR